MPVPRSVFFVSDRTGLTSENMGNALLEQFSELAFKRSTHPFIDSPEKAHALVAQINATAERENIHPLVFSSVVNNEIRAIVKTATAAHFSFFDAFLGQLEQELDKPARHTVRSRVHDVARYDARMEAVNFALNHDDGVSDRELQAADVILLGVSRSGKTPTCLYLALQYGIRAANYPLTPDDLDSTDLPRMVKPFKSKIFGLTIDPARLHHIRTERRPNSQYASPENCRREVNEAESMFRQHGIPYTSTTHKSVEELAAGIMLACKLQRRT